MGVPALFFAAYIWPAFGWLDGVRLCAVKGFLGCDCPGCGLIRSLVALTHGRLRESIDLHPLGVIIAGWLAYTFAREVAALAIGRSPPALLKQWQRDLLLGAFLVALMLQWVAKFVVS